MMQCFKNSIWGKGILGQCHFFFKALPCFMLICQCVTAEADDTTVSLASGDSTLNLLHLIFQDILVTIVWLFLVICLKTP